MLPDFYDLDGLRTKRLRYLSLSPISLPMKPLFFTLILLGSFSAYADEAQNGPTPRSAAQCAPMDIRPMHPHLSEMWNNPRDQDGVGWCYAYAAADLLSVEAGMNVSAAELSYRYNRNI